jgi:hypothetical protein
MSKLSFFLYLFSSLCSLIGSQIYAQSKINNKLTDFGILNYPDRKMKFLLAEPKKEKMDGQKLGKIFGAQVYQKTTQQIDLSKRNIIIGSKGTRITIAPGTFQYSDYLTAKGAATVHLYEVVDDIDYMIAGVYHIYNEASKSSTYLELGGMMKFEVFQGNARLRMSGEYPILVDFPLLFPEKKFHLYYINIEGIWIKKNEFGNYDLFPVEETYVEGKKTIGVRQFKMNSQGWWGFGLPHREVVILKGKLKGEGILPTASFHVQSIGKGYRAYIAKWTSGLEFSIPAIPRQKTNIVIADETGRIGISEIIQTTDKIGLDSLPESVDNPFQDIGELELILPPIELTQDLEKLQEFLKLSPENYKVIYPTR